MPPLAQPATPRHVALAVSTLPDPEFAQLRPGLWIWHAHDRTVKTDLFSAAIATQAGLYLVDPIPLADADLATLVQKSQITAIVVTNVNHQRAALDYSDRFSLPVLGHVETLAAIKPTRSDDVYGIASKAEFEVIEIEGAVAGEIALYHWANGGTLFVGDALINLDPYGFSFLPRKYCVNQNQLRRSLSKILSLSIERILFAHGTPILSGGSARLRQLLEGDLSQR